MDSFDRQIEVEELRRLVKQRDEEILMLKNKIEVLTEIHKSYIESCNDKEAELSAVTKELRYYVPGYRYRPAQPQTPGACL